MNQRCVVVGASHGGVNLAFNLRREGFEGEILLIDKDPHLPYHRPPLSKEYLSRKSSDENGLNLIKSAESYRAEKIELLLGQEVVKLDRSSKSIELACGSIIDYDTLVIANGARPVVPKILGIDKVKNLFYLRTADDLHAIRKCLDARVETQALIIGAGYIGLETAASLWKLGAKVTVVEREKRVLSRVASKEISTFFENLHRSKGVKIETNQNVVSVEKIPEDRIRVNFQNGNPREVDMLIIGVGVKVNSEIWEDAGIEVDNGIRVNEACQSNDPNVLAIGDCSNHYNFFYNRNIRLESIQNAVDQAKVAAAVIMGKGLKYDALPWFWSDQYDLKLQMVGLFDGFDRLVLRKARNEELKFSAWYFKGDRLLSVAAVNDSRSYMIGMKAIKSGKSINIEVLKDKTIHLNPKNVFLP